jgi:3-phosphoshikimate 1-carboxyvinyltransferase
MLPYLDLGPFARAQGSVRLPGSKSISNRTLLLAALAEGATEICDLLESDDTARMLEALNALGVKCEPSDRGVRVLGCRGRFPVKEAKLFLGNAGTALRPLTAALALSGGRYTVTGSARMHERPVADLVDALRALGADIAYLGNPGYPPLEIRPATIRPRDAVQVSGAVSSQFLSGLLMALPLTGAPCRVEVPGELISKPFVEITLNLMARFGVSVHRHAWEAFDVPAARYRSPGTVYVEGDASSASYFLAAGAIGGGPVRVQGVGRDSIQGDVRFADALASLGARVTLADNWIEACAPSDGRLRSFDLDLNPIPDAAMTLAVLALFCEGTCTLRNIGSWRVKETDRLAAMANELRKLGAQVEEGTDYLRVDSPDPSRLTRHAVISTYDDHRMAMCFSLVAFGGAAVRIEDPGCVAKTFPEYFERLREIAHSAPVIAIDGPSASGKGSVAGAVASALGFHSLDSGALYRLVALAALERGVRFDDEPMLARTAAALEFGFDAGRVRLGSVDVTDAIRSEAVSAAASQVAALPAVRNALLARQRDFRRSPGLVADGRDMGSIVFPDAVLKVFLTASPEERARRRYNQLMDKGMSATLADLLQDIRKRDAQDATRSVAPLVRLPDAHLLDTSHLTVEQAAERILAWYRQVQNEPAPIR